MLTFQELIKEIRAESGLTQSEFAAALGVSAVLIAMVETGQKEVSKSFMVKLADLMEVHPSSITPFLYIDKDNPISARSSVEKKFLDWGQTMQMMLIKQRAKRLKKYAKA